MNTRNRSNLYPISLMVLLGLLVLALPAAYAQEEPTPVPEPANDEPAAEAPADEPEAEAVPAAAAAPAEEAEPPAAAIPINYRQKTLVSVDGKAQANGVIELVVQPQGGEPTKVRVNVLAKAKPKSITDDLLKELDFAIDERYKVNRKADKKIVVKVLKKNPPIAITVTTQSLSGVSVTVGNG
jgi:hypothetical protein